MTRLLLGHSAPPERAVANGHEEPQVSGAHCAHPSRAQHVPPRSRPHRLCHLLPLVLAACTPNTSTWPNTPACGTSRYALADQTFLEADIDCEEDGTHGRTISDEPFAVLRVSPAYGGWDQELHNTLNDTAHVIFLAEHLQPGTALTDANLIGIGAHDVRFAGGQPFVRDFLTGELDVLDSGGDAFLLRWDLTFGDEGSTAFPDGFQHHVGEAWVPFSTWPGDWADWQSAPPPDAPQP
jgi:hypothetical protein